MVSTQDEFLTVAEIAAVLKLNQQTVRNWIDAGKLPAIHVGRRVRIRRADFDRLLEQGYSGARGPRPAAEVTGEDFWDGRHGDPVARD
ncbi:MAG: helix-turn-helix domain-containing protein [Solirubrobacteraceae bacterium]